MSLNRAEQVVYDYLKTHVEERLYWQEKVQSIARRPGTENGPAPIVESELWRYYVERSAVAAPFQAAVRAEGLHRTSMLNLAEFLLRLWTDAAPRPRRTDAPEFD